MKFFKRTFLLFTLMASQFLSGCGGGGEDGDGVTCSDGWISSSKDKQGACSSHGGIKS